MKLIEIVTVVALAAPLSVFAGEMKGIEMKDMGPTSMAKGDKNQTTHKAVGVVKKLDPQANKVTIAHEAIKSLKWPAMAMSFQAKDKALLDKLSEGRKVEFEFEQRGKDYVITSVK